MLSYALGRQLEYYDEPAVRTIIAALEAEDYRFQIIAAGNRYQLPVPIQEEPG